MCGQRMSQRVETVSWKQKWDSLGRTTTWEEPQAEINTLASLDIPRLFMVALDLEFQPALSGWENPSSWSSQECSGAVVFSLHVVYLFFLHSLWSQHSGSPSQAEFCLLVVSTALLCARTVSRHILICMGSVQREWILCVNKLPLKCKFRIFKHYWVLGILLLWVLNSFKGNQYFSSSFLVLLVWFSPLWNFFFSNYFMLSHCMQNSWMVLEPWSVEHRISWQQQLLHVVLRGSQPLYPIGKVVFRSEASPGLWMSRMKEPLMFLCSLCD